MRKLAAFAIPFSAAVFAAVYLLPDAALLPAGVLCALLTQAARLWKGDSRLRALLICSGLAAGLLWTALYSAVFYEPARAYDGRTETVSGVVLDWPQRTDYGVRVTVSLGLEGGPPVKALLYADFLYETLKPGDTVRMTAALRLAGDGKADSNRARGVYLSASAKGKPTVLPPGRVPLRFYPAYLARALQGSIADCFDGGTAAFLTALITGDKRALSGGLYSAFQRNGLAHVVAVSGLHVSFLAGLAAVLLGKRTRRAALGGVLLLLAFAGVAGYTPSVLRAVFLQCALLAAPLLGRENDKVTTLSLSLMLLLLANPYAAGSVSLQLSFASVAGIYLLTGRLQRAWTDWLPQKPEHRLQRLGCAAYRGAAATLATTAGALVFTTPLTACYFQSLSLIAPLSNLLALWAVSYAFLGGLITALVGLALPPLGGALAALTALPARYILWLAPALAKFPFASVPLRSAYWRVWLLLVYALLILYLLWRGPGKRPAIPLCCCGLTLCAALLLTTALATPAALTVTVLDVGQGQCVALTSQGAVALVDCGGWDAGNRAADYVQSLGKNRVDLLILTHFHSDHAGGAPALLERLAVDTLVIPDVEPEDPTRLSLEALAAARGTRVVYLSENAGVTLGEAAIRVYAPLGDGGSNEEGLSVLCTAGAFRALITGDMNDSVEGRLVKYGDLPPVDLLVAGHHGAGTATSQALLEAVTPKYAVISVGEGNSYGHPAPETLARLAAAGSEIYRTDWMGDVTVTAR